MTPAARLQMAIEILEGLETTTQPTDRFLKSWFRIRRFAGSKDRRAIAEQVFAGQRRRAQLAHRMGSDSPRARMIAALLESGDDIAALFSGGYGPAALTDAEQAGIAATPPPAPDWVRGEYPQWLEEELQRAFGERLPEEMAAFIARAPTDIRVNTLKTTREDVLAAIGIACAPTPYAPHGIRITGDAAALSKSPLFEVGAFEFQDEAAQIASVLCGAQPGMRVLDLAAGAGGKSLALAAAMQNQGEIIACDVRGEALFELEKRAARAGVSIIKTLPLDHGQPSGPFDLVLVDAPCSGTGTWRRQPELRWRMTPGWLAALTETQDKLLDQAAARVAPGGRLVYATCSVLPVENQDRVAAVQARRPGFTPVNLAEGWGSGPPPGLAWDFRTSPAKTGTDGFYCAGLFKIEDGGRE
ncbi:MAG: RsmB/NOP family class I SAM-dependent RNA methyltransferase [Alphaproteobacteria bacterium]|nr:RsmB/NOP family class I SAM-dependent RNA methyltransferase [Alphaproteobacteria bacterium]